MLANGIVAAALDKDVKVINLSVQGFEGHFSEYDALLTAGHEGKLITIAMGNEAAYRLSYPASYKLNRPELMRFVLNVSATSEDDFIASFSNFGAGIDVSAPGDCILSTFRDNNYGVDSGTSMAAPMVAGVAALLFSNTPGLPARSAASIICGGATPLGVGGYNAYFGHGRVSALRTLRG